MARTQFDVTTGRFNSSFTGAVSANFNQRRQHKHSRSVTTDASVSLALTNTRQLAQAVFSFVFFSHADKDTSPSRMVLMAFRHLSHECRSGNSFYSLRVTATKARARELGFSRTPTLSLEN